MDIIKNKVDIYSKIVPLIADYVKDISMAYKHIYNEVADVNGYLDIINEILLTLGNSGIDNVEHIFETIHKSNTVDIYLNNIHRTLHINTSNVRSDMSNNFLSDLESKFKIIVLQYAILTRSNDINNSKLIHILIEKIKHESVNTIDNLFFKYQNTVNLYTHYIQYKLDTADCSSKEYILALESLEAAKIIVINNVKINGKKYMQAKKNMQRYGLINMWQHMDEQQILKQALHLITLKDQPRDAGRMYGGYTPDKLTNMSNIFREKRIGLYLMVRISQNQIEFNYRALVNKKTAAQFNVSNNSGLNNMVIDKYDVVKNISSDFKDSVHKNIILGDTDSDKWLIIRTLNGTHYDIMGLDKANIFVDKMFIDKLERGPSMLIDTYQRICSKQFAAYLKQPKEALVDTNITHLQNVSNRVTREVLTYLDKKLNTAPSNLKELFEIVSGSEIEDIASRIIIESYEEIGSNEMTELSSTFLSNADYIIKGFVKSIKEKFSKSEFNEFMFKEKTKSSLIAHIRMVASNIIRVSAEKTFDPNKDIYEKLFIKKSLLNIEL